MSYQEPAYLLELVASFCSLPLVAAYRLEGGPFGAPETLAWFALCWALLSAGRALSTSLQCQRSAAQGHSRPLTERETND